MLCLESLSVGSKSMVALSLAELPGSLGHIALAMAGLDNKVHLYCGERTGKVCRCRLSAYVLYVFCSFSDLGFVLADASSLFVLVS